MQFQFLVSAEAERTEGKFESRDSIEEALQEAIDGANPGDIQGDNGGSYDIVVWEVEAQEVTPRKKPKHADANYAESVRALMRQVVKAQEQYEAADADGLLETLKLMGRMTDGLFLNLERAGLLKP